MASKNGTLEIEVPAWYQMDRFIVGKTMCSSRGWESLSASLKREGGGPMRPILYANAPIQVMSDGQSVDQGTRAG